MPRPLAAPEQCEVQRDGAVVRHNCMAIAPDGSSASHFAGSAVPYRPKFRDDYRKAELGDDIVDVRLPRTGAAKAATYTGDGYITVRHPITEAVENATIRNLSGPALKRRRTAAVQNAAAPEAFPTA